MADDRLPILLIEDNLADLRLLSELLEDAAPGRFSVVSARRLADGIAALRTGSFPVVLLDLSLPDSDGVESIEAVRAVAPDTPVVVLSGLLDDETVRLARERGAAASFAKGEDRIDGLVAAISDLVALRG